MSKVDIFLSNPDEEQAYRNNLKDYPVNIIVSNTNHVNTQRNFIIDYYKEDELILGIDDDIDLVAMKVDDKNTIQLNSLTDFVEQAFTISLDVKILICEVDTVIILIL